MKTPSILQIWFGPMPEKIRTLVNAVSDFAESRGLRHYIVSDQKISYTQSSVRVYTPDVFQFPNYEKIMNRFDLLSAKSDAMRLSILSGFFPEEILYLDCDTVYGGFLSGIPKC